MSPLRRALFPSLCLLIAVACGVVVGTGRPAHSYPDEPREPVKWEYTTATVEAGSLHAHLSDLGKMSWEVFSVVEVGTLIDQTPDGKTHLVSEKYEVTGKRPAKP